MKRLSGTLWSVGFALIGLAILVQMAMAILAPYSGWIIAAMVAAAVWVFIQRLRVALAGKGSQSQGLGRE